MIRQTNRLTSKYVRADETTARTEKNTKKVPLGTKEIVATDFNPLEKLKKQQKSSARNEKIVATDCNPLKMLSKIITV